MFAAETGLRPCEWLALGRRDVDHSAGVVLVERERVDDRTKPYGKAAASRRRVPLTSRALAALVGTFELARYMGTSVEMIERTYGHLVMGADDAFAAARSGVEQGSAESAGGER